MTYCQRKNKNTEYFAKIWGVKRSEEDHYEGDPIYPI